MRLAIAVAIAGSLCASAGASAQVIYPNANPPVTPPSEFPTAPYGEPYEKQPLAPQAAFAAAPYGARYYPGIGFRYAVPPSERIYGYYAGPRVYGYRARYRACEGGRFWFFDRHTRCGHRW